MSHIIRVRTFARNAIYGREGAFRFHQLDIWFHRPPIGKTVKRSTRSLCRTDRRLWSSASDAIDQNVVEAGAAQCNSDVSVKGASPKDLPPKEETWLVVGDGDFSFSTVLSQELSHSNARIRLVASVLESEDQHAYIYQDSKDNVQRLLAKDHSVRFEIDATRLENSFPAHSIDRIQFNFPHWRGKSNHRYNRQLLYDFFASCCSVLSPTGQIRVALCHGQGGAEATTPKEWKESWRIAALAAEHGWLLRRTEPFVVAYNVSSHRGVDRAFPVGVQPLLYIFGAMAEEERSIPPIHLQMAYRFELRILLKPTVLAHWGDDVQTIASQGLAILEKAMVPNTVPLGIRCEMPLHNIVPGEDDTAPRKYPLLVILIVLVGERRPLSRAEANAWRTELEDAVEAYFGDQVILHKGDRQVSKAFPYHLLGTLIQERRNEDHM